MAVSPDRAGNGDETRVPVAPRPMPAETRHWLGRALDCVDEAALVDLAMRMVDVPSPTGDEGALARVLEADLARRGFATMYQEIDEHRGNTIARLAGDGTGPDLMLYGHLDTTFPGDPREDAPVIGVGERTDLRPRAALADGLLTGLGITNPKGGDACAIIAADAVRRAGVPLKGDLILALVSGGIHKRPTEGLLRDYRGRAYQGFGIGCEYMLKHGVRADFAISTKPGYAVVWEEPGQCWFTVEVRGLFCYSGTRHVAPCRSAITDAVRVVDALEAWFPEYTRRHTLGQLAPQAAVGAIEGGWPFKPEFVPGVCRVYVDVRTNPRQTMLSVKREVAEVMTEFRRARPDIDLDWAMTLSVPGSRTDPRSWIVQSCLRAWEAVEQRPHAFVQAQSGTTDGNVLRNAGIPTARLGLPGLMVPEAGWPPNYDACRVESMVRLTRAYVHAIVDTCARRREDTA
jgi:acetylornithine deacetylase/succinyl-diaminopimelate desuccinylase-like protein